MQATTTQSEPMALGLYTTEWQAQQILKQFAAIFAQKQIAMQRYSENHMAYFRHSEFHGVSSIYIQEQ